MRGGSFVLVAAHSVSALFCRHARKFLGAKQAQVLHKKYFFVVRPLLAILWIFEHGTMYPMMWDELLQAVRNNIPEKVLLDLEMLARNKRQGLYSGKNADTLWPHLSSLEEWYEPLIADGSALEARITACADLDDTCKARLRERMDDLLVSTVTRVNGWYRQ
jgi:predicted nucleotidyltransferase